MTGDGYKGSKIFNERSYAEETDPDAREKLYAHGQEKFI